MKKLVTVLVIALIAFELNAQVSSKSLLRQRDKEIQAIEKVSYSPAIEAEKIAEVNNLYIPLIERSMEIESEKTSQKKAKSSQFEVQKRRTIIGANVDFEGDRGTFSANSMSTLKGSQAYATVSMADANAYLVRSMADGSTAKMSAPDLGVGLEGVIMNKYRYQELEVKIVGVNPGNTYNKTFLLGKEQSITDYLLPGTYRAYIKGLNNSQASAQEFIVTADKIHSINGKNVYWGIWGGTNW